MKRKTCKIVKLQVPVQVRSSQVQSGPVRSRSGPVRSSPVQVQSGPDLDLDLDKTKGPGLTLKSCRPPPPLPTTHYPPPPATFKHEGGVPHKNPKSKTDLEWSPEPIQHKKFQVDDDREYMGQSSMSKENIINFISFNQSCQPQALSGSLSGSSLTSFPNP